MAYPSQYIVILPLMQKLIIEPVLYLQIWGDRVGREVGYHLLCNLG